MSSVAIQTAPRRMAVAAAITALGVVAVVGLSVWRGTQSSSPLRPFAGDWSWHSIGVHISPEGHGTAAWRVYEWCNEDPKPPCDRLTEQGIVSGGNATFALSKVTGKRAFGRVTSSTDPATLRVGPLKVQLAPGDHLTFPGLGLDPLCGPRAHSDCGA
jgi:hypothetical protein